MFLWARKLKKKEGIEEKCKTTFNTLHLGLFTNVKNYFEN